VRTAHPRDYRWVAKGGWRAGEVIKEPNPGAKKYRSNVDVDFVEQVSIPQLPDGVCKPMENAPPPKAIR